MQFKPLEFIDNLGYMGLGMLGIFIVIGVIVLSVVILNKVTSSEGGGKLYLVAAIVLAALALLVTVNGLNAPSKGDASETGEAVIEESAEATEETEETEEE